ncbi:MAG: hypothetical protein AAFY60_05785, partial [Myxococcota bacterium]
MKRLTTLAVSLCLAASSACDAGDPAISEPAAMDTAASPDAASPESETPAGEPEYDVAQPEPEELPTLGAEDVVPSGEVTETDSGYRVVGGLQIDAGDVVHEYQDADLTLTFDDSGELIDVEGEAELPVQITETISLEPGLRAIVGMRSGR